MRCSAVVPDLEAVLPPAAVVADIVVIHLDQHPNGQIRGRPARSGVEFPHWVRVPWVGVCAACYPAAGVVVHPEVVGVLREPRERVASGRRLELTVDGIPLAPP